MTAYKSKVLESIAETLQLKSGDRAVGSNTVTEGAEPRRFYASLSQVSSFASKVKGFDTHAIGIIVSPEREVAGAYEDDTKAFLVSMGNPYFPGPADSLFGASTPAAYREGLQAKGHDGIVMPNGAIIVFDSNQLTLAEPESTAKFRLNDLFPEEFADADSFVERKEVVSSNGATRLQKLGNIDSTGALITTTVKGLENFWDSFYGTQAVDDQGRPLLMYHSTNADISRFEKGRRTTNNYGLLGDIETSRSGFFFSPNLSFSQEYLREGDGQNVMPVYLNLQNPLDLRNGITESVERELEEAGINVRFVHNAQTYWELFDNDEEGMNDFVEALEAAGYDGAIFPEDSIAGDESGITYVAFQPEQIKSAIGNRGTFDLTSPDIRYSRAGAWDAPSPKKPVTENEAFKKWFVDSKVIDAEGKPLVVYHGTTKGADFSVFRAPAFFTSSADFAGHYADEEGGAIIPVYLSLKNPVLVDAMEHELGADVEELANSPEWLREQLSLGYDGLIVIDGDVTTYVAFSPEQIKSAIGNQGTFDKTNPDIRFSRSTESNFQPKNKVMGDDGQPLVLYRAIAGEWDEDVAAGLNMTWASTTYASAANYAEAEAGVQVVPVILTLTNPADLQQDNKAIEIVLSQGFEPDDLHGITYSHEVRKALEAAGYDGIRSFHYGEGEYHYAAFSASQVQKVGKSPDTNAFKSWFAQSKVVDSNGEPLRVYHGGTKNIEVFDTRGHLDEVGSFFTSNPASLGEYVEEEGGNITPVFLNIENPYEVSDQQWGMGEGLSPLQAREAGYDGYIIRGMDGGDTYVAFKPEQIKSAIGNNARFDPTNPDIRYSFAGIGAVTADMASLRQADKMAKEGISQGFIQRETGWHKGIDGRWRFEISDDKAVFHHAEPVDFAELTNQIRPHVVFENEGSLVKARYKPDTDEYIGGFGRDEEDALTNLTRHISRQTKPGFNIERVKDGDAFLLEQVLDHPTLYAAYPFLAGMVVQFKKGGHIEDRGSFFEGANRIELNADRKPEEILSTLLHEAQHAIQAREDFARGGNSDMAFSTSVKKLLQTMSEDEASKTEMWKLRNESLIDDAKRASELARNALKFESVQRLISYGGRDKPSGVFRLIRQEMQWLYSEEFRGNREARDMEHRFYEIPKRGDKRNFFLRDMAYDAAQIIRASIPTDHLEQFIADKRTTKGMVNALRRHSETAREKLQPLREQEARAISMEYLFNQSSRKSAYDIYRSLAGEIEARTTQARQHLTAEERRNRPVINDIDVHPSEAIVIVGGMELIAPFAKDVASYTQDIDEVRNERDTGAKMTKAGVLEMVEGIRKGWSNAPEIEVVQSIEDLPWKVYEDAAGAYVEGKVFLIADNLVNLDHAEFVLLHEVIGHHGLAGVLGAQLDPTMLEIYERNPSIKAKADAWMSANQNTNVALATEEALSDIAGKGEDVSGWKKLAGAMRKGIRAMGFKLQMSDIDVHVLISDSRRWVEKGRTASRLSSLVTRYSRASKTLTGAFKKWFGKSRVCDANGEPLVVYTGTSHDIEVFNTQGRGKTSGSGAFFSDSPAVASTYTGAGVQGGNIMPVYLKLEKPAIFDCKGANWNRLGKKTSVELPRIVVSDQEDEDLLAELMDRESSPGVTKVLRARKTNLKRLLPDEIVYDDDYASTDDMARWARKQGYDGVIFKNVIDQGPSGIMKTEASEKPGTIYVCFKPEHIKSAIGNNGEYSLENPDVRYSLALTKKPDVPALSKSEAFDAWFKDSKAVTPDGKPLVVYHGTPNGHFDEFDTSPMFFTDNKEAAMGYATGQLARDNHEDRQPTLMSVYLCMQNPKVYTEAELAELITADEGEIEWGDFDNLAYCLEEEGYDGVIIKGTYDYMGGHGEEKKLGRYDQYVVFRPEQIKSADLNVGSYDPTNPDIRYSRASEHKGDQRRAHDCTMKF